MTSGPVASLVELESGGRHPLADSGSVTIGRAASNDVVLDDRSVSRSHALVSGAGGAYELEDLASANGTYVERSASLLPASPRLRLLDGDLLRVGVFRLRFEVDAAVEADPTRGQPWTPGISVPTVAAGFAHFFGGFFLWALAAVLAPEIGADVGLSAGATKLLPATAILFGAAARLVFGFQTDRRGPLPAGTLALLLGAGALVALAVAGEREVVLWPAVALLGVGLASLPVAMPMVSRRTPPERRGLALGVMGAGSVGIVVAAVAAPALAAEFGWQTVCALALVPVGICLAIFVYGARGPWAPPAAGEWRQMARGRGLREVMLLFGITFGSFAGLYTFLPVILTESDYGLTQSEAGLAVGLGALLGAAARVISGFLADRVGAQRVLLTVMASTAVLLVFVAGVPLGPALVLLLLSMMLFDAGTGATFKLAAQHFGSSAGVGAGIVSACGGLFGFALATLLASLVDSPGAAFGLIAAAPAAVAVWKLLAPRLRPGPVETVVEGPRLEHVDLYGTRYGPVPIGDSLTIGRGAMNRLVLDDPLASRDHAAIAPRDGRFAIVDAGSTNGTFLWRDEQWRRVEDELLADTDIIVIGETVLRFAAD